MTKRRFILQHRIDTGVLCVCGNETERDWPERSGQVISSFCWSYIFLTFQCYILHSVWCTNTPVWNAMNCSCYCCKFQAAKHVHECLSWDGRAAWSMFTTCDRHTHYPDASNSTIITLGKPELLTTGQVGAYKHQHTTCLLGCPGLTFTGISRYVAADDKHKQWPLNCVQAASLLVLIKQIWDHRYMTSTTWLWPLSLINVCFPG